MNPDLKRKRLLLLATAAVVVATLLVLYLMGSVLLTLGLSAVIAYVLFPLARLLERGMPWRHRRPGLSRGIAVGIIFLAGLGLLVWALILAIPPTLRQGARFVEAFPGLFNSARATVEGWAADYSHLVPEQMRDKGEEWLGNAGGILGDAALNVGAQTLGVISGSVAFVIGLATAPVLIFYLMKDSDPIRSAIYTPFPAALRPYLRDVLDIVNRTLGGYIRGQLILGVIVGVIVTGGLLLLGVPFAVLLGIVAGLTELIPIIGPWIGGAAGVLVTLATAPDKVLWVILLYLVVQLLENSLLVPRVQSSSINLHPIVIIMTITVGSQYFGLWGVILGPPLVAMVKDLVVYFVQEWNRPAAPDDAETAIEATEPDAENSEAISEAIEETQAV